MNTSTTSPSVHLPMPCRNSTWSWPTTPQSLAANPAPSSMSSPDPARIPFTAARTSSGGTTYSTRGIISLHRNLEFFDNISYHHGRHTFTFGGYFFHLSFNPVFPNNARGTYTYNGSYSGNALADFLFGYPSQGQVGIGEGAENAHTNWAHFYFQDGWQLTPGLKVDLGIRYEYNSNLVAETNQTSNIDLSTGPARVVVAGNPANLTGSAATLAAFAAAQNPSIPVV